MDVSYEDSGSCNDFRRWRFLVTAVNRVGTEAEFRIRRETDNWNERLDRPRQDVLLVLELYG